jgi:hypothetical protein
MPSKKGSKIAASQARAKSAAKKKANSSGPVIAAAAVQAPELAAEETSELEEGAVLVAADVSGDPDSPAATTPAPAVTVSAPRRTGRTASRRERQALTVMSGGSLQREVITIGMVTAAMGVALAVLKIATDLGR